MYTPTFEDGLPTTDVVGLENRPHQIGELAEKFGITLRTIRFYEERGLIKPRRASARVRLYDLAEVGRLGLIVACRRYGLGVDEIADLLTVRDRDGIAAYRPHLIAALAARRDAMRTEIREAELRLADLDRWLGEIEQSL